jgi:hypothetical protein
MEFFFEIYLQISAELLICVFMSSVKTLSIIRLHGAEL